MDAIGMLDAMVALAQAGLFGFLCYGGWTVLTGGRFHRDAPEDPRHPHLDLSSDS